MNILRMYGVFSSLGLMETEESDKSVHSHKPLKGHYQTEADVYLDALMGGLMRMVMPDSIDDMPKHGFMHQPATGNINTVYHTPYTPETDPPLTPSNTLMERIEDWGEQFWRSASDHDLVRSCALLVFGGTLSVSTVIRNRRPFKPGTLNKFQRYTSASYASLSAGMLAMTAAEIHRRYRQHA